MSHIKELRFDDLEFLKRFGVSFAAAQDTLVKWIVENGPDGGVVPIFTLTGSDAVVVQEMSQPEFSVSGGYAQVEHHADNLGLLLINYQPTGLMFPLVEDAAFLQAVTVGCLATPEPPLQHHLAQGRFGANGGLLALTIGLPKTDVVGKSVGVGFKPLLSLIDTPDPDTMFHEPLHYEGGLIRFAAQTVEHEHKQDVELALFSPILEKLEFVPVIGADLKAGYTVFLFLAYNDPAHLLSELPAGFTLHWDISLVLLIVIHLFCSGYSI